MTDDTNGHLRRRAADTSTLGRLNYHYERLRVLLIPLIIWLATMSYNWVRDVDRKQDAMLGVMEILVRSKCAEMTDEQIEVTGLDCRRILGRRLPPQYGNESRSVREIAPTIPDGNPP